MRRNALLVATAFALGCGANVLVVDPVERGSDGAAGASGAPSASSTSSKWMANAGSSTPPRRADSKLAAAATPPAAPGGGGKLFQEATEYETSPLPQSVVLADFNGDGALDIAVGDGLGGPISVMLNVGEGGLFAAPISVDLGGASAVIAAGDFDGDGLPDLAGSGSSGLFVARNLGAGEFGRPTALRTEASTTALATGDVDGDGLDEIVTVTNSSDAHNVFVYADPLAKRSEAPRVFATAPGAWFVAVRDLDRDELPEIVVACSGQNRAGGSVAILRNTLGGFAAPELYEAGSQPASVAIHDLDHDGQPDIIARSVGGVFGLRGQGGKAFGPSIYEPMMDGSPAIAAGDVDGDGEEDILTESDSKLAIVHGPSRHEAPTIDEYPIAAREIALADLDEDGQLDLVAVGSSVRVMLHSR